MNDRPASVAPRFFQPPTLLAGVVLGLVMLAIAGRLVTTSNWHRDFVRFHPYIAPETLYQPTIGEMRAIIRSQCRPDQILVVVGGNSIFQGVGQPVQKLWTRRLQERLGSRYAVINLAFRGSAPTDGGALAAESLRDEYPHQIYLANVPPFKAASPGGSVEYFFMTLDAYHKGWLLDHVPRDEVIADRLSRPDIYPAAREQNLGARLDAALRFRDLWNWWSATRWFTFPTTQTPDALRAFRPRNAFPDVELDFEAMPFTERFAPRFAATELTISRNTAAPFYELDADGAWRPVPHMHAEFGRYARTAFPDILKARTLIVVSPNSPHYVNQLSPDEQARDALAIQETVARWHQFGYAAADYGPGFEPEDFGDRTHLTARGGAKLAERLAPEIRRLALELGYPSP